MKTLSALAALLFTQSSFAAISSLYVFGDSLSDNGNAAALTAGTPFATPERFTNGPVWNERLGIPVTASLSGGTNYAVGGAQTDRGLIPGTGLAGQLNQFQTALGGAGTDPLATYVLFFGGNDLARIVAGPPADVVPQILGGIDRIFQAVTTLQGLGARHIVIANAPDISRTPVVVDQTMGNPLALGAVAFAVNLWNGGIASGVAGLANPNVQLLDINTPYLERIDNPGSFGLTNVTDAVSDTPGANPDEYFFWDPFHPTASAHQGIAEAVLALPAVPEPSSLALIALGGLLVLRKRR